MKIKAVVNTPGGPRWQSVRSVVAEIGKRHKIECEVVSSHEIGFFRLLMSLASIPYIEIDGEVVIKGRGISYDDLDREVKKRRNA